MAEIYCDTNGTLLTDLDGNFITTIPIPSIDLMFQGNQFPPRLPEGTAGRTRFQTSGENTIYIDFGDGSPIYTQEFTGLLTFPGDEPIHNYANTDTKTAKIWFEYPQRVTHVIFFYQNYIGPFPLNLGFYNLDNLTIQHTRFEGFPLNFLGGVFNQITIQNITMMTITFIPSWILNSRISSLSLHGGINLENDTTDSIENIINIQDLTTLSLANTNLTDVPTNFKDITTLRRLFLGNNPFTEITQNVNDCKQLTEISFGYHGGGYWTSQGSNLFTSWGIGIANMPELQVFRFDGCHNAPDTLPTGIETAPNCKTIWARVNRPQERQDTFIENVYNQVVSIASIATGEGVLRRTTLRMERFGGSNQQIPRPTGIYQAPAGYVQGVSNGTPSSPMEMIYVLVNQYEWTIYVTNEGTTGHDIYAP